MTQAQTDLPATVDLIVIGAGPAGSTLAGLLKKYRPETSVLMLEKAHFPRHQVGESLILNINGILADLGCADACDAAGFSRKWGVNFAWGEDRSPRRFDWREAIELLGPGDEGDRNYTWHVDRFEYDDILAKSVAALGAEVRHGYTVSSLIMDGDRVVGVRAAGPNGEEEIGASWVIDAAGGSGPVTKSLSGRVLDETLRNIAVWGYFEDVHWVDGVNGSEAFPRTAILSHEIGWCWVIPLRDGRTSVGFVTHLETYRTLNGESQEEILLARLRELPEFEALLSDARLVQYRDSESLAFSAQEFSYTCNNLVGPGWAATGNASGFVDVILSTGCYLAQLHAQFLAYALVDVLNGSDPERHGLSWYETVVQENLWAFRQVAYIWYRFSSETSDWWRTGRQRVAEGTTMDHADRASFFSFLTGFQARHSLYDGALGSFGSRFVADVGEAILTDDLPSNDGSYGASVEEARDAIHGNARLRITHTYQSREFGLPDVGKGTLLSLCRVDFDAEVEERVGTVPEAASGLAKKLYVDPEFAGVLELFDGTHTLAAVAEAYHRRTPDQDRVACRAEVDRVATALLCMQLGKVVEPDADRLAAQALVDAVAVLSDAPPIFTLLPALLADADTYEYSVGEDAQAIWRMTFYFDVRDQPGRLEAAIAGLQSVASAHGVSVSDEIRAAFADPATRELLQVGIGVDARPDPKDTRMKLYFIADAIGGGEACRMLMKACGAAPADDADTPHIVGLDLRPTGVHDVKVYTSLNVDRLPKIFRKPKRHHRQNSGAKHAVLHESRLLKKERRLHVSAVDSRKLRKILADDPAASGILAHIARIEEISGFALEPWIAARTYRDGELFGPLTVYYRAEPPDAADRR